MISVIVCYLSVSIKVCIQTLNWPSGLLIIKLLIKIERIRRIIRGEYLHLVSINPRTDLGIGTWCSWCKC